MACNGFDLQIEMSTFLKRTIGFTNSQADCWAKPVHTASTPSLAFLKKVTSVEITAKNNMKYPWSGFDYFDITLDSEEMVSSVIISHASNNYVADLSIFGTEGILKLDLQTMLLMKYRLRKAKSTSLAMASLKPAGEMIRGVFSNGARMLFAKNSALMRVTGHGNEIEQFVQSIVNVIESPVTAEEGRDVIRVMEMLVQKLNQKYPVPVAMST